MGKKTEFLYLNEGEMILFDKSQKDEVLGILSEMGYRFWSDKPLSDAVGDKWGIRWSPIHSRAFPNCLSTMDHCMASNVREFGHIDRIESISWTVLEYEDFMARVGGLKPVEVDDLL